MRNFKVRIIAAAIVFGTAITLSGCGDDLDERPYVMTCSILDAPYSAADYQDAAKSDHTFDLYAGGLNLPSNEEISQRGGTDKDYFRRGFLTDVEGQLDASHIITAPMIDRHNTLVRRIERSGWYEVPERPRDGTGRKPVTPIGWSDIEHYTIDASGELTPVKFQLTTLSISDQGRGSTTRQADIGAKLPSDARYVIYKITMRDIEHDLVDSDKSLTTYWAVPLEDKYRWAPKNWEAAQQQPRAFSDYAYMVGNLNGSLPSNTYPLEDTREAERRRDVLPVPAKHRSMSNRTVDCFAGTHAQFYSFVDLFAKGGERNLVQINNPMGYSFVGFEESDLQLLPSNPDDWDRAPVSIEKDGYVLAPMQ